MKPTCSGAVSPLTGNFVAVTPHHWRLANKLAGTASVAPLSNMVTAMGNDTVLYVLVGLALLILLFWILAPILVKLSS